MGLELTESKTIYLRHIVLELLIKAGEGGIVKALEETPLIVLTGLEAGVGIGLSGREQPRQ